MGIFKGGEKGLVGYGRGSSRVGDPSSDGAGEEYKYKGDCSVSTPGTQLKPGKYAVIVSCNTRRGMPMKVTFAIHSNKIENCSFVGVCDGTSIVEAVTANPTQKGPDGVGKPKE